MYCSLCIIIVILIELGDTKNLYPVVHSEDHSRHTSSECEGVYVAYMNLQVG
jgi:hypothetical protein